MKPWLPPLGLLALTACGSSPSAPDVPGQAPRTVAVVSAETGQPVAGALLSIGTGSPVAADGSGRIAVALSVGSELRLEAPGFFVRTTLYRGDGSVSLWPTRAGAGATFVEELVFNRLIADGALTRPATNVTFVPRGTLRNDVSARAVHERAAATLDAVVGGSVRYAVADSAVPGSIAIEVKVDPADEYFLHGSGFQAVTRVVQQRNRIMSGSITFKSLRDAGSQPLVSHEMGHAFGLGHPSQAGLMSPSTIGNYTDFTASEKLEMRIMLQRLPGTRPPDDDRSASASSARRNFVVGCGTQDAP
jgi:hypothetical protein